MSCTLDQAAIQSCDTGQWIVDSCQLTITWMSIPGRVLPYKRLMGMCRWMGSHFHDWIDYNGVAFYQKIKILGLRLSS